MIYRALVRLGFGLMVGSLCVLGCSSEDPGTQTNSDSSSPGDGTAGGDGGSGDGSVGQPGDGEPADGASGDGETEDGAAGDGTGDGATGDGDPGADATYFRADSFVLVAPRAWGTLPIVNSPLEVTNQVNDEFAKVLVEDNGPNDTPDGIVDLNMFVRFLDPAQVEGAAAVGGGECTAPLDQSACTPDPVWPFTPLTYTSPSAGSCLASAGEQVSSPCFVTAKADVVVTLGAFRNLPLKDFQLAGKLSGTRIESGLIRGFLTEADAMAATLPDDLPPFAAGVGIVAGAPLSSALHADEQEERDGVPGWWVTTTVTAAERAFTP